MNSKQHYKFYLACIKITTYNIHIHKRDKKYLTMQHTFHIHTIE